MSSLRHRAADALLRRALDGGADRREITRGIEATRAGTPGYETARAALACAGWVDAVLLWSSLRLRRPGLG